MICKTSQTQCKLSPWNLFSNDINASKYMLIGRWVDRQTDRQRHREEEEKEEEDKGDQEKGRKKR